MDLSRMPLVRLELERMKEAIVTHLGVVGSEYEQVLGEQISKAIAEYPWEKQVSEITHSVITESITSWFRYGEGHALISDAVQTALDRALIHQATGEGA